MACAGPWIQSLAPWKRKGRKENGKRKKTEKERRNEGKRDGRADEPIHGGQVSLCLPLRSLVPCAPQVDPMVCIKELHTLRPLLWLGFGQQEALLVGGWDGRREG